MEILLYFLVCVFVVDFVTCMFVCCCVFVFQNTTFKSTTLQKQVNKILTPPTNANLGIKVRI